MCIRDRNKGLIALGLFKDYDDIRNSPTQKYGPVMPGDIKYKDVNGDGTGLLESLSFSTHSPMSVPTIKSLEEDNH